MLRRIALVCFALYSTLSCVNTPSTPAKVSVLPKGKKIRVMVIDTGISPIPQIKPFLAKTNSKADLTDNHGHGTHITGLILYGPKLNDKVCPEVEIHSCQFYKPETHTTTNCFKAAKNLKMDVVNFSGGGRGNDPSENEAVKAYPGQLIVAVGNEESNNEGRVTKEAWNISEEAYYPASLNLPNMIVVGNGTSQSDRADSSNWGLSGMVWRDGRAVKSFDKDFGYRVMSGSSQATAIYTHEVVQKLCQRLRSAK